MNWEYMASDDSRAIKRMERALNNKPAKSTKPSGSVIDMTIIDLVKAGKVGEANAILNQRIKGDK